MQSIDEALEKLARSKFRSGFRLDEKDREYVISKGETTIKRHAREIIEKRLKPAVLENDGRQTPTKGHPVFKAQHACACCCRGCLEKWYRVKKGTELTDEQVGKIVDLLWEWIRRETERGGRK